MFFLFLLGSGFSYHNQNKWDTGFLDTGACKNINIDLNTVFDEDV